MYKGDKFRIFPTPEQEILLLKHIDCCRYIWNWGIETQKRRYEQNGILYLLYSLRKELTMFINSGDINWIKDVSRTSLDIVLKDLDVAYKRFFNKISGYPKFRSKKIS